jgi:hypothetical protein
MIELFVFLPIGLGAILLFIHGFHYLHTKYLERFGE